MIMFKPGFQQRHNYRISMQKHKNLCIYSYGFVGLVFTGHKRMLPLMLMAQEFVSSDRKRTLPCAYAYAYVGLVFQWI